MTEDRPLWHRWYEGKDFSNDWSTSNIATWLRVLDPYKSRPMEILEVGSWEGRSAIAFLEILPLSRITCVDQFAGSPNHLHDPAMQETLARLETRFDDNTSAYGSRLRKIKDRSAAGLDRLTLEGHRFDMVYVDGSHRRDDVLADSFAAWRLLKIGGLLIFDDLHFHLEWEPSERPADAIKMFCAMFGDSFRELHRGRQLIVRKEGEWPAKYRAYQTT
jgi:predicted O-methyltransferase YrrM